jgi:hypothetical protein
MQPQPSSEPPEPLDALEAATRREPLAGAGVDVRVFDAGDPERAEAIARGIAALLRARGRAADFRILPSRSEAGLGPTLETAAREATQPLVLVTDAVEPWTAAHLDPLLAAIDAADHVIGRRPAPLATRLRQRLAALGRSLLFAMPVLDVHSPCRLHRRAALAAIPLQSESRYADVELLAKATFLAHLLQEVPVPPLAGDDDPERRALWSHDRRDVLRRPVFARPVAPSSPAKEPQREQERPDGPGGQDGQRLEDLKVEQPGAVEDHEA